MPNGVIVRARVSKLELVAGSLLLIVAVAHFGWCKLSVPRHGVAGPHGPETGICNWGADLSGLIFGIIAVLTIFSGAVGYPLRLRAGHWYVAQIPAAAAWAWIVYVIVYAFFIYDD
jgi:hypothetical protein